MGRRSPVAQRRVTTVGGVLVVGLLLTGLGEIGFAQSAGRIELVVDASKAGPKIDRNLFGQFAERLGTGVYEDIWVGADSPIPNTRGIWRYVPAVSDAPGREGVCPRCEDALAATR